MRDRRDMFLVAQSVVEKIATRYGYEKLGEFTFLLSQYCIYWDNFATGEGFDFSRYSEAVLIYFDVVRDEIDEKHRQFISKGSVMADNAKKRWEQKEKDEKRKEQKRQWYVDNSEKVNSARRKNVSSDDVFYEDEMSSGVSSDRSQSLSGKALEQNDANLIQNHGIMEHKNFKENYGSRACGNVDNFSDVDDSHAQSSGLTGHNRPKGSVIKNHKKREHKNRRKRNKERRTQNLEQRTVTHKGIASAPLCNDGRFIPPPQALASQLPEGSDCSASGVVSPPAERKTIYGDTWIKIGDDFEVPLFDRFFECADRANKRLIRGFEDFARKKWNGCRKDKWWLKDQLTRNFANRQGDISYMFKDGGKG